MSRMFPKARLIIVHDHGGRGHNDKCYLTERIISGLGLMGRVVTHNFPRFLEYINATVSPYDGITAFVEHRSKNFKITTLPEERKSPMLQRYCAYFTDLKIWLDENPNAIIVVQGCSFLEEIVFRATNTEAPDPTADDRLAFFLEHFKKLFTNIPTLSILVKDMSNIPQDDVRLKAYQKATTYWVAVNNTDEDYFKIATAYNLFDFGQKTAAKKFVRVQKKGGMSYWLAKTTKEDVIGMAVYRLCTMSSSQLGRTRRLEIHPGYLQDLCDFVGIPVDDAYYHKAVRNPNIVPNQYTVTYHETDDDLVNTKDLNDLELCKRAGKTLSGHSAKFIATRAFWDKLQ